MNQGNFQEQIFTSPKKGNERFFDKNKVLPFSLFDFWSWMASDLISNATRGKLAEFIVGTAVNLDWTKVRDEWAEYDLITLGGIKIEVKSAGYIQTWSQKGPSKISFSIRKSRKWTPENDQEWSLKGRWADVYVFCLFNHTDKKTADPMNLSQWVFYVVSTKDINAYTRSETSITLKSLAKLANEVRYESLKAEIMEKAK